MFRSRNFDGNCSLLNIKIIQKVKNEKNFDAISGNARSYTSFQIFHPSNFREIEIQIEIIKEEEIQAMVSSQTIQILKLPLGVLLAIYTFYSPIKSPPPSSFIFKFAIPSPFNKHISKLYDLEKFSIHLDNSQANLFHRKHSRNSVYLHHIQLTHP